MRLIDADAFLKNAGIFEKQIGGRGNGKSIVSMAKAWLFSEVDNAPTINPDDLRPRGRWVHDHYENCTEQFEIVKCSNCGFTAYAMAVFVKGGNYCPDCGAKMDGKENEDA